MKYEQFYTYDRPDHVITDQTEMSLDSTGWHNIAGHHPEDVGKTFKEAGNWGVLRPNDILVREPVTEEIEPRPKNFMTWEEIRAREALEDVVEGGIYRLKPGDTFNTTGEARQFETGARRDANNDKGRMDLLPWLGLIRLSKHFQKGANTHGERNWEKGMPISVLLDSTLRHLAKAQAGLTDEDHITAATWGLSCVLETLERIKLGTMDAKLNDVKGLT
jgi:hypothetical protein